MIHTATAAQHAAGLAARLTAELTRLGRWSAVPLDPLRLEDMGAFGQRTLAGQEWLQFVLVPRLRAAAAGELPLPPESHLAAWAVREFDGDPDAADILAVLHAIDRLAASPEGGSPLHEAASGFSPALETWLTNPGALDFGEIPVAPAEDVPLAVVAALLDAGSDPNGRPGPAGMTPLMLAAVFGLPTVGVLLLARGADPGLRDALGRTAERLAVYATITRVLRWLPELPMVRAAWLAQVHAPLTGQYTTPVLGLELTGPLPPDAFAAWPHTAPLLIVGAGDDPLSRLMKLAPPIYRRAEGSGRSG